MARMDRWTEVVDASGQTHLPLKQATRVETGVLAATACEGRVNLSERKRYRRGLNRFAWTRADTAALCLFLKLLFPTLTTSIFLSVLLPPPPPCLFGLSPYAPVRERMDP